jgi:hypothetical protein
MKSALKGRRFCDATDIIKNATEELKMVSQNGFQECFQHLYSRWQKCIVAKGGNFGGTVAYFAFLRKSNSGNILNLAL